MNLRIGAVLLTFLALVTGCSAAKTNPDANDVEFDAGNPTPKDACSGGCASNQICDTQRKVCVDACGGCDAGTCVKVMDGVFECRKTAVTCDTNVCAEGQVACLGGACSCLAGSQAGQDSCRSVNKWCSGTTCKASGKLQQCRGAGATACQPGLSCVSFGGDLAFCLAACSKPGGCDQGEYCEQKTFCVPNGMLRNHKCLQNEVLEDGGLALDDAGVMIEKTVSAGNTCLVMETDGGVIEPRGKGTGNCVYTSLHMWDQGLYTVFSCRPSGTAQEGAACKLDYSTTASATQCGAGLECAPVRGGVDGVCMRTCNAAPPVLEGHVQQPACGEKEACVNVYRMTDRDRNSVLGVCMKSCNIFDSATSACSDVGAAPANCIPARPLGDLPLSTDGAGVCIPQQKAIAAKGATCPDSDPFHGATCGVGQICATQSGDDVNRCTALCDLSCSPSDGGAVPARCATQANAKCSDGKTCKQVVSNSGARIGFCL
jgi:hypothetical protein